MGHRKKPAPGHLATAAGHGHPLSQAGSPVGIRMIGQDVVTAGDQLLVHTSQELIRLRRAQDALQGVAADLSHALRARLQQKGEQGANDLRWVHLVGPASTEKVEPSQ